MKYGIDYKAVPCTVPQTCKGCMFSSTEITHSPIGVCRQPKDESSPLCCNYKLYPDGLIFVPGSVK
jgi:hypothetical protein